LLPELWAKEESVSFALAPEAAHAKLRDGVPLLRGEALVPDQRLLPHRWRAVGDALGGEAARALDPGELLAVVLAGTPEQVHIRAETLGLDAGQIATMLRLTCYPLLSRVAAVLAPLRAGVSWPHGYCPTCGSWPVLGEFRGLDQVRVLRCGLCASAWEFPRLRCVFCDNRDHRTLGYLHVEGEQERSRAATCEACHGYVKMVSTLGLLSPAMLLVTDMATLHLDLVAAERGFMVPV
jgi:FdhE protein